MKAEKMKAEQMDETEKMKAEQMDETEKIKAEQMDETENMDTSSVDTAAMDTSESLSTSEDSKKLLELGLNHKVIKKLEEVFKNGKLAYSELDQRALNALKEFPVDGALVVLDQFVDSSLDHVSNKSAYLCGIMKTYRQKNKVQPNAFTKGPDQDKIKVILDRTGYSLDVTTGQRKYGGPPPDWTGPTPSSGCEVFVGKIPRDVYEDELIPLFEECGTIWDLRLMMDPLSGLNRGYAFITYTNRESAQKSVRKLDNFEIKKGKELKVNVSVPNLRLFVGNIPKSKSKEEIFEEFTKITAGLSDVIIYSSPDDKKKNRGFCFLEFECHKSASLAKRRLGNGRVKVWGCDIIVDWADPQEEPDEETMSKVKVLYAKNLTIEITEEKLKEVFETYGQVERVKKIKDYAFIHFEQRNSAVKAMEYVNGGENAPELGLAITVSLAKPPSDKKKKEEMLRNREKRMMHTMQSRAVVMGGPNMPPMGRMGHGRMGPPDPRWDYDYDYYGYNDYQGGYGDPYDDFYGGGAGGGAPYDDYYDYGPGNYGGQTNVAPPLAPRGRGAERGRAPSRGMRGTTPRGRSTGGSVGRGRGAGARGRGSWGNNSGPRSGNGMGNRGTQRGNLSGKRKFDGGHQNQGDTKRRFQNKNSGNGGGGYGQQKSGDTGYGTGGEDQWYQDSYGTQWS